MNFVASAKHTNKPTPSPSITLINLMTLEDLTDLRIAGIYLAQLYAPFLQSVYDYMQHVNSSKIYIFPRVLMPKINGSL